MPRFAKQNDCPASSTLLAYSAGNLSYLARPAVAVHINACEFCGAEASLLTRHAHAADAAPEPHAPAMPLALRLFAESALADINAPRAAAKRAA